MRRDSLSSQASQPQRHRALRAVSSRTMSRGRCWARVDGGRGSVEQSAKAPGRGVVGFVDRMDGKKCTSYLNEAVSSAFSLGGAGRGRMNLARRHHRRARHFRTVQASNRGSVDRDLSPTLRQRGHRVRNRSIPIVGQTRVTASSSTRHVRHAFPMERKLDPARRHDAQL